MIFLFLDISFLIHQMKNTYLLVPNIIGYVRIILLIASWILYSHPIMSCVIYLSSCLLDAVDGSIARLLKQESTFGQVLDMVIDRSSTASLLVRLGFMYPAYIIPVQVLISLDFSSHYMIMFASTINKISHKTRHSGLLSFYYDSNVILFLVCAFCELFYVSCFLGFYFNEFKLLGYVCFPVFVFKQVLNLVQLVDASNALVQVDLKKR